MIETTWFWAVIAFILWLLVVLGAYQCAKRKDRSEGAWASLVAFLPITFAILAALPKARGSYVETPNAPRLICCPACGKQASSLAKSCPHCGNPISKTGAVSNITEALGWVSFLVIIAAAGYQYTQFDNILAGSSFPKCDSYAAKQDVESAIAGSPLGKVSGISIISWSDIQTESHGEAEEVCRAKVTLNTAARVGATYRFYNSNGQTLVRFQIDDE